MGVVCHWERAMKGLYNRSKMTLTSQATELCFHILVGEDGLQAREMRKGSNGVLREIRSGNLPTRELAGTDADIRQKKQQLKNNPCHMCRLRGRRRPPYCPQR